MNKKYLALISRIEDELMEIDKLRSKILAGWKRVKKDEDSSFYLDSVALNLHGFYSAFERIFELVAQEIDESLPKGSSWHQDLLIQMKTEIKKVRPAVISRNSYQNLDEYRSFRHVVRNVYTFNLSYKRIEPLVEDLDDMYYQLEKEIKDFIQYIEKENEERE